MTNQTKTQELKDQDLDSVQGGAKPMMALIAAPLVIEGQKSGQEGSSSANDGGPTGMKAAAEESGTPIAGFPLVVRG